MLIEVLPINRYFALHGMARMARFGRATVRYSSFTGPGDFVDGVLISTLDKCDNGFRAQPA